MHLLKDITTLADGESGCLAGCYSLAAMVVILMIMAYIFAWVRPHEIKDILDSLRTFVEMVGGITTVGATGKLITNKAEPT